MTKKTPLKFILLKKKPLVEQLSLEQALLSNSQQNYVLLHLYPQEAVVMGISGKPEQLIHPEAFSKGPIPCLKRYSGGGCVYIHSHTLMLSFIFNKEEAGGVHFPQAIMQWTFEHLKKVFPKGSIQLKENDFTLGEKKFAGNAQYIKKRRFCHHLTLLHYVQAQEMARYLKYPPKAPVYRKQRNHEDFLTGIHPFFPTQEDFAVALEKSMKESFELEAADEKELQEIKKRPFRNSNREIEVKKGP